MAWMHGVQNLGFVQNSKNLLPAWLDKGNDWAVSELYLIA